MTTGKMAITIDEFAKRLADLFLRRGGGAMPRRRRDQHILMKSIVLSLDPSSLYSEKELNARLKWWLAEVGQELQVDHVSIRRYLVDEGYVMRDPAGVTYRVAKEAHSDLFDSAVERLRPETVIRGAVREQENRKREFLSSNADAE